MIDRIEFFANLTGWIVFLAIAQVLVVQIATMPRKLRLLAQSQSAMEDLRRDWSTQFRRIQAGQSQSASLLEVLAMPEKPGVAGADAALAVVEAVRVWRLGDKELAIVGLDIWGKKLWARIGTSRLAGYAVDFGMLFTLIGSMLIFGRLGASGALSNPIQSLGSFGLAMGTTLAGLAIAIVCKYLGHHLNAKAERVERLAESLFWRLARDLLAVKRTSGKAPEVETSDSGISSPASERSVATTDRTLDSYAASTISPVFRMDASPNGYSMIGGPDV